MIVHLRVMTTLGIKDLGKGQWPSGRADVSVTRKAGVRFLVSVEKKDSVVLAGRQHWVD